MQGSLREDTQPPRCDTPLEGILAELNDASEAKRRAVARRRGTAAVAAVLAAGAAVGVAGHAVSDFVADHHIGAPAPLLECQAPDTITSWWVPDSSPEAKEAGPWGVRYEGWTEMNGCGEDLTIGTKANP
jgi:hypothetical protein